MSSSFVNNLAHNGAPASIVVVAKCPKPGTSKTRLIPALGEQGAAELAKAMMLDVLSTIAECKELNAVEKVLYYAPNEEESRQILVKILRQHNLNHHWRLKPVSSSRSQDLQSSQLSHILQEALKMQQSRTNGPVVFLGMDAPEIPLRELVVACFKCEPQQGFMCPASDGGYCLLSVPTLADSLRVFNGVQWSHPMTALSQLKALSDQGISMAIGPMMHDVDDENDLLALCKRLQQPPVSTTTSTTSNATDVATMTALARPSLASRSVRIQDKDDPPVVEPEENSRPDDHHHPIKSIAETIYETLTLSPPSSSSTASSKRPCIALWGRRQRPCHFTRKYLVSIGRLPPSMEDDEEDEPMPDLFSCGSISPSGDGDLFQDLRAVWTKQSY